MEEIRVSPLASDEYAPLYCEENVFRTLLAFSGRGIPAWGLLISNRDRSVAIDHQRVASGMTAVWDYHVVTLVSRTRKRTRRERAENAAAGILVIDPDSTLPRPSPLVHWLQLSFPVPQSERLAPVFRLLTAREYLRSLVSDRSHMRSPDGSWLAPPPPWPAPGQGSGEPSSLMDLIDMEKPEPGHILSPAGLLDASLWGRGL